MSQYSRSSSNELSWTGGFKGIAQLTLAQKIVTARKSRLVMGRLATDASVIKGSPEMGSKSIPVKVPKDAGEVSQFGLQIYLAVHMHILVYSLRGSRLILRVLGWAWVGL